MVVGILDQALGSVGLTGTPEGFADLAKDFIFSFTPVAPFIPPMLLIGKLVGGKTKIPVLGYMLDPTATTNVEAVRAIRRVEESLFDDECARRKGKPCAGTTLELLKCNPYCWRPVPKIRYFPDPPGFARLDRLEGAVRHAYEDKGAKGIQLALEQKKNANGVPWLLKDFIWARLRHDIKAGLGPQYVLDILREAGDADAAFELLRGTGTGKALVDAGFLPDPAELDPLASDPLPAAPSLLQHQSGAVVELDVQPEPAPGLEAKIPSGSGPEARGDDGRPSHGAALALLALAGILLLVVGRSRG